MIVIHHQPYSGRTTGLLFLKWVITPFMKWAKNGSWGKITVELGKST
jgi:hypothetical protein